MRNVDLSEKYIDTIRYLQNLYDFCNEELFNGELGNPVITIQLDSRNRTYGWFTVRKVWKWLDKVPANCAMCEIDDCPRDGSVYVDCQELVECEEYELNITAQQLNRPIKQVAETMIHEMCHYYAALNNIQDTSRSGTYHNKLFKDIAEKHGLTVRCAQTIGWSCTELTEAADKLISVFIENNPETLIYRTPVTLGQRVKTSSTRKYKCPCCGSSVRATKAVNVECADCCELMRLVY